MAFIECILLMTISGSHLAYGAGTEQDKYVPPKECAGKTYCTIKPADYPQERFNEMLKGTIPIHLPIPVIGATPEKRIGVDPDYKDDCESIVTYDPIFKVMSSRGWHTVVQAPAQNYVQKVRLETCSHEGGTCFLAFPPLPVFKTYCKQTYISWEFIVASDDGNGTEKVSSDLPVCCSCHYKTID